MTGNPAGDHQTGIKSIDIRQLGLISYDDALIFQQRLARDRAAGKSADVLLLVEHPPTYTVGLRGDEQHFCVSPGELEAQGAVVRRVNRGGSVTFHGPGQLVGYPIIDVKARCGNIARYVWRLEQVLIGTLTFFGLQASRIPGYRGVWVNDQKIAAIGIRVNAAGISTHGFAVNINTDLSYFNAIIACGIPDKNITSLARELDRPVSMHEVCACLGRIFVREFGNPNTE